MPAGVEGAIIAALIAAAVSVLIFAVTQIIALAQRVGAGRRARIDAVLGALEAVILETRSPQVFRLWSKTEARAMLAVSSLVGSLPAPRPATLGFPLVHVEQAGRPRRRAASRAVDGWHCGDPHLVRQQVQRPELRDGRYRGKRLRVAVWVQAIQRKAPARSASAAQG